jgi:uncharacterized cysteine cluster protein YcgN (CxxCxxCC family)
MDNIIWVNPIVKGVCDPFRECGGGCCKIRVYEPGNIKYHLEWCEHFDESARKCKIYESRPEGCRTYPMVRHLRDDIWNIHGCGYYLEET